MLCISNSRSGLWEAAPPLRRKPVCSVLYSGWAPSLCSAFLPSKAILRPWNLLPSLCLTTSVYRGARLGAAPGLYMTCIEAFGVFRVSELYPSLPSVATEPSVGSNPFFAITQAPTKMEASGSN